MVSLELILFLCSFTVVACVVFVVLRASNFEKLFKQGRVFEIRIAYVIVIMIISFIIARFITYIYSLFN